MDVAYLDYFYLSECVMALPYSLLQLAGQFKITKRAWIRFAVSLQANVTPFSADAAHKDVYAAWRASGWSRNCYAAHEHERCIHKAAKKA